MSTAFTPAPSFQPTPPGCPVPDETHTYLVTSYGKPVLDRGPVPGDKYALPPLPYHYAGYIHSKIEGQLELETAAKERSDRERLETMILDLSQTKRGREWLEIAYENGMRFGHNPAENAKQKTDALNDIPTQTKPATMWLCGDGSITGLQLTIVHEIGHFFRNLPEKDAAGESIRPPSLVYNGGHSAKAAIAIVRAQEASSEADAAEHAVQCEQITNPDHYKPKGVFSKFAASDLRQEIAKVALSSAHLVAQGRSDEFHQAVHIAFYAPKTLAFYDLAVLNNFNHWSPRSDACEGYKRGFMVNDDVTHDTLAQSLPYLRNAPYSLDAPENHAMTNDPRVLKVYRKLEEKLGPFSEQTPHKPIYQHCFMNEVTTTANQSKLAGENSPLTRMFTVIGAGYKQLCAPAQGAVSNLAVMPPIKELRQVLPSAYQQLRKIEAA